MATAYVVDIKDGQTFGEAQLIGLVWHVGTED